MLEDRKKVKLTEKELFRLKEKHYNVAKANALRLEDVKAVLDLKMHESVWCASIYRDVLKVHNGWIYSTYNSEDDLTANSVFVEDTRNKL